MEKLRITRFRDRHVGQRCIVSGLGNSLLRALVSGWDPQAHKDIITFGVNDVCSYYTPNYVILMDAPGDFAEERREAIKQSRPNRFFIGRSSPWVEMMRTKGVPVTTVKLKFYGDELQVGTSAAEPQFPTDNNTPFVAMSIAKYMGFSECGVIGVDYRDHHLGVHNGTVQRMNRSMEAMKRWWERDGKKIWMLSDESLITVLPRKSLEDFLDG